MNTPLVQLLPLPRFSRRHVPRASQKHLVMRPLCGSAEMTGAGERIGLYGLRDDARPSNRGNGLGRDL